MNFVHGALVFHRSHIERINPRSLLQSYWRLSRAGASAPPGAAIAGGCALLTGADAVFVDDGTTAGYPVHGLGVSPAVTTPTLRQSIVSIGLFIVIGLFLTIVSATILYFVETSPDPLDYRSRVPTCYPATTAEGRRNFFNKESMFLDRICRLLG